MVSEPEKYARINYVASVEANVYLVLIEIFNNPNNCRCIIMGVREYGNFHIYLYQILTHP